MEAEAQVVSLLLSDPAQIERIAYLTPGDFSDWRLGLIFGAIAELVREGKSVNLLSVADRLTSQGKLEEAGGPGLLASMAGLGGAVSSLPYYADYVKTASRRRAAVASLEIAQRDLISGSIEQTEDILQNLQARVEKIVSDSVPSPDPLPAEAWAAKLKELIEKAEGQTVGIPSGIRELDLLLGGGWRPENLIIIAGRPGTGKSSLALQFALFAAKMGKRTGFLSLEMSTSELMERAIALCSGVSLSLPDLKSFSSAQWEAITAAVDLLACLPLRITDRFVSTAEEVLLRARSLRREMGRLDLLIVDYIQLMGAGRKKEETREREVAEVSKALKGIARDLEIPVIALSQFNRRPEDREEGRPRLSDLRESGALEQDADIVLALYRPASYNPEEYEESYIKLEILKHRNGRAFVFVELDFCGALYRFEPWRGPAEGRKKKEVKNGKEHPELRESPRF